MSDSEVQPQKMRAAEARDYLLTASIDELRAWRTVESRPSIGRAIQERIDAFDAVEVEVEVADVAVEDVEDVAVEDVAVADVADVAVEAKPALKPKAKPALKPKAKPALKPKAKPALKPKAKPISDRRVHGHPSFTDDEINAVIASEGALVVCPKCGSVADLMTSFGLRRMASGKVLRQSQCRDCRYKSADRSRGRAELRAVRGMKKGKK